MTSGKHPLQWRNPKGLHCHHWQDMQVFKCCCMVYSVRRALWIRTAIMCSQEECCSCTQVAKVWAYAGVLPTSKTGLTLLLATDEQLPSSNRYLSLYMNLVLVVRTGSACVCYSQQSHYYFITFNTWRQVSTSEHVHVCSCLSGPVLTNN